MRCWTVLNRGDLFYKYFPAKHTDGMLCVVQTQGNAIGAGLWRWRWSCQLISMRSAQSHILHTDGSGNGVSAVCAGPSLIWQQQRPSLPTRKSYYHYFYVTRSLTHRISSTMDLPNISFVWRVNSTNFCLFILIHRYRT